MNAIVIAEETAQKTITSLELSEISGRRHDVILKSIDRMNKDLMDMSKPPAVVGEYKAQNNKTAIFYTLTIYQCELLALALDGIARIKVLDKLEQLRELQKQPTLPRVKNLNAEQMLDLLDNVGIGGLVKMIETSLKSGLIYRGMLNISQEKEKQLEELVKKQEQEISELKANNNKHKALQTSISELAQAEILMSMEEVGILLGMSRNKLYQEMRFRKFLKKDNAPYKYYDGEYFIQKKVNYKKGHSKNIGQYMQTFILPKGLELLKSIFLKQQAI